MTRLRPVRVLVIDDSATMRKLVIRHLQFDGRVEVVGEAGDPIEAKSLIDQLSPDVLLLDLEMPRMSGLEFLKHLNQRASPAVVIFSSLAHKSRETAIIALEMGAVDVVPKPHATSTNTINMLPARLLAAANSNRNQARSGCRHRPADPIFNWNGKIVLIGASTGGVEAIQKVLADFPENSPPTLIAQHMPAQFLASFAKRLNDTVAPKVQLASHDAPLTQGHVMLAPGGNCHLVISGRAIARQGLRRAKTEDHHIPSIDALFRSGLSHARNICAVVLSGMGSDGANGLSELKAAGSATAAQDEKTSTVYGMPRAAAENRAAESILPIGEIGPWILNHCHDVQFRRQAKNG